MKLLKRYKWLILILFLIFSFIIIWIAKDLFATHDGALYGNRLDGIKDVPIAAEVKKDIKDVLLSKDGVTKISTNVHGLIFYINIYVDDTMTVDNVKSIANEAIAKLSEEQLGFYDVSILVDYADTSDKKDFPILGYKNKNKDSIVW